MRVLELARERTAADAAVAIVGTTSQPILATVGLSQPRLPRSEASESRLPRCPRDSGLVLRGRRTARREPDPQRARVPLLDSPSEPGILAVLTRTPDRRFSEVDITSLENVLSVRRPALETSLELREPDPVPERDPLTDLYDRPAFHALLDLEIGRARGRREQWLLLSSTSIG